MFKTKTKMKQFKDMTCNYKIAKRMRSKGIKDMFLKSIPIEYPHESIPKGMTVYNIGEGQSSTVHTLGLVKYKINKILIISYHKIIYFVTYNNII